MSVKTKWPRAVALAVAAELGDILTPFCERLEIAGSLRRGKPTVGDIELLFIPKSESRADGLFDTTQVNLADEVINRLLSSGVLAKRPNVNGSFAWGEKNKLAIHGPSGIPVDLFATTAANWWVSLVVRTGSKETNLELTTGAQRFGRRLNAYGSGVTMPDGSNVAAKSEQEVFHLCGCKYREPKHR
jgi:DNA polymerase (family 10)